MSPLTQNSPTQPATWPQWRSCLCVPRCPWWLSHWSYSTLCRPSVSQWRAWAWAGHSLHWGKAHMGGPWPVSGAAQQFHRVWGKTGPRDGAGVLSSRRGPQLCGPGFLTPLPHPFSGPTLLLNSDIIRARLGASALDRCVLWCRRAGVQGGSLNHRILSDPVPGLGCELRGTLPTSPGSGMNPPREDLCWGSLGVEAPSPQQWSGSALWVHVTGNQPQGDSPTPTPTTASRSSGCQGGWPSRRTPTASCSTRQTRP